ncbi:MAG: hypothetical protein HeimC3_03070 [Candidatus Heimdallarchaeota archaeon LC_3]|nr:MAG: hypothetical protein HeimC3_03070 [Candidatus Heimdallarchaeota archaeon LC_3]
MKKYVYLFIFVINLILSFVIPTSSDSVASLIQFYIMYFVTTLIFMFDWIITKPRYSNEQMLDSSVSLQSYFHIMTNYGDRLMALAIIAVCDIVIFGMAVPDSVVRIIESDFGTPFLLTLITIFIIPALLLKLFIEPYAKKSEKIIYQRMKEGILSDKIVIPPEIIPYINSKRVKEREIEFSKNDLSLSLQAYPATEEQVEEVEIKIKSEIASEIDREDRRELIENANKTFIISIFPELSEYVSRKPVSIQSAFFYEILNKVIKKEAECRIKLGL